MSDLISTAKALVQSSQPDQALELLAPEAGKNQDNVEFLQLLGEVLLETNNLEEAYNVLMRACELDSEGDLGVEKLLYLGQIIGGHDGIKFLDTGLNKLNDQLTLVTNDTYQTNSYLKALLELYRTKDALTQYLVKKLNQGIFAEVEIWMTDLCMEEQAETQCDALIEMSLKFDDTNPEAYSLLSSIRISQQRNDDAVEALQKAWDLFQSKKAALEDDANKAKAEESEEAPDSFELSMEYIELIQPLLTLARFAIELQSYDLAIAIASNIQDINDNILDCYYYEGLAYIFKAKQLYSQQVNTAADDYRDISTSELKNSDDEIKALLKEAQITLTNGYKVINTDSGLELEQEVVDHVNTLLKEVGGPLMSELLPQRPTADDDDWEDEITSDNE